MICILSHNQARRWKELGERPNCGYHAHMEYTKAQQAVDMDEAIWVDACITSRAIIIYDCVLKYEWRGRKSGKFTTLQLVKIGT